MRRLLAAGLLCAACAGGSRESTLIEEFFATARLQDTAALSAFSRVSFNPRVDGTVQRFSVTKIGVARQEGASTLEEIAVDAQVRTPDGEVRPRRLVFTLERSDTDRWMIVGVRPGP